MTPEGEPGGGFRPPPYPYDRLDDLRAAAERHEGGLVDLSIGTPNDPPPAEVVAALSSSGAERGYPTSVGSAAFRKAAAGWMGRRFDVDVPVSAIAACVGTKELVASLPHLLRLRNPARDTVLHPGVAYPSYEMGAILAGCHAVPVPVDDQWRLDLAAIDPADVDRALCLWVNTPGNPAGNLDDLRAVAAWGRERGVLVLSDECYAEFTWDGEPRTILAGGLDGVLALHSLSKRSNLAGLRAGFYAGDPTLVHYLSEVRKHAGLMVPGPVQLAATVALDDDGHVAEQRERYRERVEYFSRVLEACGLSAPMPGGSFYLWAARPGDDGWGVAKWLAEEGGALVSPGEFYGPAGGSRVRVALVHPLERLERVAERLGVSGVIGVS
ncbi:MAG: succinyldiaminopimelate transaminase [Acidimicrobiales bacterium]